MAYQQRAKLNKPAIRINKGLEPSGIGSDHTQPGVGFDPVAAVSRCPYTFKFSQRQLMKPRIGQTAEIMIQLECRRQREACFRGTSDKAAGQKYVLRTINRKLLSLAEVD